MIKDQTKVYFMTFTIVDWLEVFNNHKCKCLIIDSLKYCQSNKELERFAYCIMINHIHLIGRAAGKLTLSDIVRDFKKYTSKKIIDFIRKEGNEKEELYLVHDKKY